MVKYISISLFKLMIMFQEVLDNVKMVVYKHNIFMTNTVQIHVTEVII